MKFIISRTLSYIIFLQTVKGLHFFNYENRIMIVRNHILMVLKKVIATITYILCFVRTSYLFPKKIGPTDLYRPIDIHPIPPFERSFQYIFYIHLGFAQVYMIISCPLESRSNIY